MIAATGGGGGTDWAALRVDQMWAMIAPHDTSAHTRLIGGWRRSYELVQQHITQVRQYRDNLATAWPPSRSPAAAAYFTRLDALLANLAETQEAAAANHRAFAGATGAIRSARREMSAIAHEHAANETLLAAYAEQKHLHQLTPGKARAVPPQSPVADGRQAALEARARAVMSGLSTELAQAQVSLVVPTPYEATRAITNRNIRAGGTAASSATPPLSTKAPSLFHQPTPPGSTKPADVTPSLHRRGLDRSISSTSSPHATPIPPTSGGGGQGGGGQGGGKGGRGPVRTPGPGLSPTISGESTLGIIAAASRNDQSSMSLPARTSPPIAGHVIGAPPGTPSAGRTTEAMNSRLINPVGGVIGGTPPRGRSAEPADRSVPRPRIQGDTWHVPVSVDPVLQPRPQRPIDPGPAIGRT
ncbi:hypothetical protein [Actinoplanes sp. DH11]|uniref:hypothetical protein n=1 Tax=Actinoplanes sp. DH11 TaxID=2857011 RepID=UPI001E45B9CF|nr:hypothetical protein [Actinoplanes sp. DH11]